MFYLVGGYIRDKLLGIDSKDIDFAVEADSFEDMKQMILDRGCNIYLETPEYYTIRAHDPEYGPADFVWCRKEGPYSDGRHPDWVEPGDIYDDLSRRDFTMNAIAQRLDGSYLDPLNGIGDTKQRLIRCVGKPADRFKEDRLRILRGLRFNITKGMLLDTSISKYYLFDDISLEGVSIERIREELYKMFKHNTFATLELFNIYFRIQYEVFNNDIWLKPTLGEK